MMISDSMNGKLNTQVTEEFAAAHSYLAMSCAFDAMGYKILAKRFLEQADEERAHAMKIIRYIQEVGGQVTLASISEPKGDYAGVEEIVRAALASEQHVTKLVNDLVGLAEQENDYATRSFLGWFVDEQVEEVAAMSDLLRLVELAGGNYLQVESRVRHEMTGSS